ncbi:MAG: hypothetical protein WC222_00030 [Parachlamydiales bacterium]|jgi:hypothetical protein
MNAQQTIEKFIQKVLMQFFPENALKAIIKPFYNTADFGDGGFGSPFNYHIFDQNNTLLFVAKSEVIDQQQFEYAHLLHPSSSLLKKLPLEHSKLILPFYSEAHEADNAYYQCVAIEAAKGQSITRYISALAKKKISLFSVLEITKEVGTALSELNALLLYQSHKLESIQEEEENKIAGIFALYIEEHPEWFPFTLEEFKAGFAHHLIQAYKQPFSLGVVHGDSNISNIYYQEGSPSIQFIDSLSVFQSISPQGKPIGNIAHEFSRTLCSFQLMGFYYGLAEDEISQIKESFIQNYTVSIPTKQIHFYSLLFWMAYTIICYKVSLTRATLLIPLTKLRTYILDQAKILLIP